jgi:hypothetical protein
MVQNVRISSVHVLVLISKCNTRRALSKGDKYMWIISYLQRDDGDASPLIRSCINYFRCK